MYSLSYTGIEFMNILYLQVYIYSKQYLRLCYKFTAAILCLLLYTVLLTFHYQSLYTCFYTWTNSTFILICNTRISAYFTLPGLGAAVRAAAIAHVPCGSLLTMSSAFIHNLKKCTIQISLLIYHF